MGRASRSQSSIRRPQTTTPQELILDFDPTNDPIHGNQEQRFFHGYPLKDLFAGILSRLFALSARSPASG